MAKRGAPFGNQNARKHGSKGGGSHMSRERKMFGGVQYSSPIVMKKMAQHARRQKAFGLK